MKNRNYTNEVEIFEIFVRKDLNNKSNKVTYKGFPSRRKMESYRNKFESRLNSLYKTNCSIDLHFREKI